MSYREETDEEVQAEIDRLNAGGKPRKSGIMDRIKEAKRNYDAGEPERRAKRFAKMEREREELAHRRKLLAEKTSYARQQNQYRQVTTSTRPQSMFGGGSMFGQSAFYGQQPTKKTSNQPTWSALYGWQQPARQAPRRKKKVRYTYVRKRI